MKKIFFIILLFSFCRTLKAQDFQNYWKRYDNFQITSGNWMFEGGRDSLEAYIYRNIRFSKQALENRLTSHTIHVKATINDEGKIIDASPETSGPYYLGEIAKDIVLKMPKWMPKTNSKYPFEQTITILFDYEKWMPIDSSYYFMEVKDSIQRAEEKKAKEVSEGLAEFEKVLQRLKEQEDLKKQYIKQFGSKYGTLISENRVEIGMTKQMCIEAWGEPNSKSKTLLGKNILETFYYDSLEYLKFKNGRLIMFHSR